MGSIGSINVKTAEHLFGKYRQQLVRYSQLIVGCQFIAEEIVQEVFLRFATKNFSQELQSPIAYLRVMVRNESHDFLKKRKRETSRDEKYSRLLSDIQANRHESNPETGSIYASQMKRIAECLDSLPPLKRRAITLYFFEELSFRKIADELGISVGKAHALVSEAISQCEAEIGKDG